MLYGILKNATNTGLDSELAGVFAAPLLVASNQPAFVGDTMTLRRIAASTTAQRWELSASIAITQGDADLFMNMVLSGYSGDIYVRMPQMFRSNASIPLGLTLTLNGSAAAGTNTINISGAGNNLVNGEFIKFASHSKVYMIVDKGTSGNAVKIFPNLISTVPTSNAIAYGGKVTMKAKYDPSTILGISFKDGILSDGGTIKIVEAL